MTKVLIELKEEAYLHMDKQSTYVRAILDTYPEYTIETAHLNQGGQFNDILVVNDDTIFRFPKTSREATKLETEAALLRNLQSRVILPIPNPLYRSQETTVIGEVFMGYSLLVGEPFWPGTFRAIKDEGQLQHLATRLAMFLRQLHTTPVEALNIKLPDFQGCEEWQELYNRFRSKLFSFMRPDARIEVARQFEDFLSDERNCNYAPALIHGDFGPGNILYDAQTKNISGIIDFSSASWGDPAVDFAALTGPVSYAEQFLERFGAVYPGIEATLSRARFYAGTFALQEALYGIEDGDQGAFERGIATYR